MTPYRTRDAVALADGLGLKYPVAATLARRGLTELDRAADFLAARTTLPAGEFTGIAETAIRLLEATASGTKITIYGDFDADGVCATTIMVELLRDLGGDCDWFIPDRIADGYGLSREALDALKARGTELVVTVDCGISSISEVEYARSIGLEIIVTDHHQLGSRLPDCRFLHPEASDYPFAELCGAAVAWKLAQAVRAEAGIPVEKGEGDLDLVALATVTDVMPLTDENRHLVRQGVAIARRASRPGMRALLAEAGVEPTRLEAEDFAFRLGPRINAAGRMYRADAGVELFLTGSPERAAEISAELTVANAERKRVERGVEAEAGRAFRELTEAEPNAVVVAGEDWHRGVVGIVAARLVRSHGLPAVVISTENGVGRGSARSIPGVDLYRALASCDELLEAYGGHPAAAGLSIRTEMIDQFRQAFGEAVIEQVGARPETPLSRVDACIGGQVIGMELAEEVDGLRPFGRGNPAPTYLIPSARIENLEEMGEGRHCRFTVASGDSRAGGIAFGRTGFGTDLERPLDLVAELSVNHWNGTTTPRLQVVDASPAPGDGDLLAEAGQAEWWERFEIALTSQPESAQAATSPNDLRKTVEHRASAESVLAEVISTGEGSLILVAEAWRRWRSLGGKAGLSRFSPHLEPEVVGRWAGSPGANSITVDPERSSIVLLDYRCMPNDPAWISQFENVILFDPATNEKVAELVGSGAGFLHHNSDRSSLAYAFGAAESRDPRPALRGIFRTLRERGDLRGGALREALARDGLAPRAPEEAACLVKVMVEAGIAHSEGTGSGRILGTVSSREVDIERSGEFQRLIELQREEIEFLKRSDR